VRWRGCLATLLRNSPLWMAGSSRWQAAQQEVAQHFREEPLRPQVAPGWLLGLAVSTEAAYQDEAKSLAAEEAAAWRQWARDSAVGSASKAHRFSREPEQWTPTTTQGDMGRATAAPKALLAEQVAGWSEVWQTSKGHPDRVFRWPEHLEVRQHDELGVASLRAASRSFPEETASTADGLHVRHFSLLSDEALLCLAKLFVLIELLGDFPVAASFVLVALLEKPAGGFRPIGIFPGIYRLWIKCRRDLCQAWELRFDQPFFAMSRGRRVTDPVWRHAVSQEAATLGGEEAAGLLWDLVKYYESVPFALLLDEALATDFPLMVLRLCIKAYQFARWVSLFGMVEKGVRATRGIIAGCGGATTLVKLASLRRLLAVSILHPEAPLDVFVDDLQLACEGDGDFICKSLPPAARTLHLVVKAAGSTVSQQKAALVASSEPLARRLRDAIGPLAGSSTTWAKNLGVDYSAGRARAYRSGRTARKKRLGKAAGRLVRLGRLKRAGARVAHVFVAGVRPLGTYGVEVTGVSDAELHRLNTMAFKAMSGNTAGRSRSATFLMQGLPFVKQAAAAMLRWASEVWVAASYPTAATMSLAKLRRCWRAAERQRPSWRNARGPMGIAKLEAKRLGWRFLGPFSLQLTKERVLTLTRVSPGQLAKMIAERSREQLEEKLGTTLGKTGERWSPAVAERLARSAKTTAKEAGTIRALAANGLWSRSREKQAGYAADTCCPLCEQAEDTSFHRLMECPAMHEERMAIVDELFLERARAAGPMHPLFSRGLVPHPPLDRELPQPEDSCWCELGDGTATTDRSMQGELFVDGSCSPDIFDDVTVASWAVATLNPSWGLEKAAFGRLWEEFPQSSGGGEWAAYALAHQFATGPATIVSDYLAVVEGHRRGMQYLLRPAARFAAMPRSCLEYDGIKHITEVVKVKAHQSIAELEGTANRQAIGNSFADSMAKRAAAAFDPLLPATRAKHEQNMADARLVCLLAAKLWGHWPAAEKTGRPPRQAAGDSLAGRAASKARATKKKAEQNKEAASRALGHRLVVCGGGGGSSTAFKFCDRCGAHGAGHTQNLQRACKPTGAGLKALSALRQGLHPRTRALLPDGFVGGEAYVYVKKAVRRRKG